MYQIHYPLQGITLPLRSVHKDDVRFFAKVLFISYAVFAAFYYISASSIEVLLAAGIFTLAWSYYSASNFCSKTLKFGRGGTLELHYGISRVRLSSDSKFYVAVSPERKSVYLRIPSKNKNILITNFDERVDVEDVVDSYNAQFRKFLNVN